jgi:hypothetical protein
MAPNPEVQDADKWKNLKQAPGVITTTIQKRHLWQAIQLVCSDGITTEESYANNTEQIEARNICASWLARS